MSTASTENQITNNGGTVYSPSNVPDSSAETTQTATPAQAGANQSISPAEEKSITADKNKPAEKKVDASDIDAQRAHNGDDKGARDKAADDSSRDAKAKEAKQHEKNAQALQTTAATVALACSITAIILACIPFCQIAAAVVGAVGAGVSIALGGAAKSEKDKAQDTLKQEDNRQAEKKANEAKMQVDAHKPKAADENGVNGRSDKDKQSQTAQATAEAEHAFQKQKVDAQGAAEAQESKTVDDASYGMGVVSQAAGAAGGVAGAAGGASGAASGASGAAGAAGGSASASAGAGGASGVANASSAAAQPAATASVNAQATAAQPTNVVTAAPKAQPSGGAEGVRAEAAPAGKASGEAPANVANKNTGAPTKTAQAGKDASKAPTAAHGKKGAEGNAPQKSKWAKVQEGMDYAGKGVAVLGQIGGAVTKSNAEKKAAQKKSMGSLQQQYAQNLAAVRGKHQKRPNATQPAQQLEGESKPA